MYLNQAQLENVRRTLRGVVVVADKADRRLADVSINKTRIALTQLRGLVDYALEQLK